MSVNGSSDDQLDELISVLLTASRVFVAIAARSLAGAEVDVTIPQYRVLIVLAAHGTQGVGSLADALGVNASTATRMCDRLVRKKLISRRSSREDRREVRISLTELGRELIEETTRVRRVELARLVSSVPTHERHTFAQTLKQLNASAGEIADENWAVVW